MTEYHARQPWALAFIVFGSVARGNWDAHSDLDLDVVTVDGAVVAPVDEIMRLCAAIGERPALIAPRRGDDGDVILASLAEFSIRYHPLHATSPNIISSMRILWSRIDEERIRAAGLVNAQAPTCTTETLVALSVRATLAGATALARGRSWAALAALVEARDYLMTLFARARGGGRPLQTFERDAEPALQVALARTVASHSPSSLRAALLALCDLLDQHLDAFTGGAARLTEGERATLAEVRARLLALSGPAYADDNAEAARLPTREERRR